MAITASEARRRLASLIERVNLDRSEVEVVERPWSSIVCVAFSRSD